MCPVVIDEEYDRLLDLLMVHEHIEVLQPVVPVFGRHPSILGTAIQRFRKILEADVSRHDLARNQEEREHVFPCGITGCIHCDLFLCSTCPLAHLPCPSGTMTVFMRPVPASIAKPDSSVLNTRLGSERASIPPGMFAMYLSASENHPSIIFFVTPAWPKDTLLSARLDRRSLFCHWNFWNQLCPGL